MPRFPRGHVHSTASPKGCETRSQDGLISVIYVAFN